MIFIDYITVMLINMTAGLFVLAHFVFKALDAPVQKSWAAALAIPGFVALVNGLHMSWVWPVPGACNSAFGEMSILFGILFLGAALATARSWNLAPIGTYAFFAGIAAIIIGVRFIDLKMTRTPILAGLGFILTGAAGVFACPVLYLRSNRALRASLAILLVVAALVWAVIGYTAYWKHMETFSVWKPQILQAPPPPEDRPIKSSGAADHEGAPKHFTETGSPR
jgi:putative membrane protein